MRSSHSGSFLGLRSSWVSYRTARAWCWLKLRLRYRVRETRLLYWAVGPPEVRACNRGIVEVYERRGAQLQQPTLVSKGLSGVHRRPGEVWLVRWCLGLVKRRRDLVLHLSPRWCRCRTLVDGILGMGPARGTLLGLSSCKTEGKVIRPAKRIGAVGLTLKEAVGWLRWSCRGDTLRDELLEELCKLGERSHLSRGARLLGSLLVGVDLRGMA